MAGSRPCLGLACVFEAAAGAGSWQIPTKAGAMFAELFPVPHETSRKSDPAFFAVGALESVWGRFRSPVGQDHSERIVLNLLATPTLKSAVVFCYNHSQGLITAASLR